jgi:hypothetical protein
MRLFGSVLNLRILVEKCNGSSLSIPIARITSGTTIMKDSEEYFDELEDEIDEIEDL